MKSLTSRYFTPYLYLITPLVLLLVFFVLPVCQTFWMSLQDYGQDLYQPQFVGLENYQTLVESPAFWKALGNTFLVVLGVVPAMCILPIVMALLINQQLKGIALFRTLIYLPVIISMVVVGIAWKWLYAYDGLINYGLTLLGLPKTGWLVNPDIALWAVMLVIVWKGLAYYMMMYLAHLQSISQELYQAAEIDGANRLQKHWHITIPALWPTIIMVAIISTIGSLKVFTEIYVMTQGGPVGSTQTLVYQIYEQAFQSLDLGLASAGGLVLMVILILVSLVQLRFSDWESLNKVPHKDQQKAKAL
jgi:putative chitobiose transport system permease protein